MVKRLDLCWCSGLLLVSLMSGCGKPGVDANSVAGSGPQLTQHRSQAEQVQQLIKDLQQTGSDAPEPLHRNRNITILSQMGAEAKPALPVLQKIADDPKTDDETRANAKAAIQEIQSAIDG